MSKVLKVDLTLLKRLVSELELALDGCEVLKEAAVEPTDYVVEMSKTVGLATGITLEASMLALDIQTLIKASTMPSTKDDNALKGLMELLKGSGGTPLKGN